jgi:hypothetical protein
MVWGVMVRVLVEVGVGVLPHHCCLPLGQCRCCCRCCCQGVLQATRKAPECRKEGQQPSPVGPSMIVTMSQPFVAAIVRLHEGTQQQHDLVASTAAAAVAVLCCCTLWCRKLTLGHHLPPAVP